MQSSDGFVEPEAVSLDGARHFTGLSDKLLRQAIESGALSARKAGRRVVILKADLRSFLASLPPHKGRVAA